MEEKINRFSKENKDQLVLVPNYDGFINMLKRHIAGPLIDFSTVIVLIIWDLLFLKINFNSSVFIVIHFFLILLSLFFLYNIIVKFNKIKTNTFIFEIENLKQPFSFIFVSDLHLGKNYASTHKIRLRHMIKIINDLNPEVVILGGDFLNYEFEHNLLFYLKEIRCQNKIGVYGNHDAYYLKNNKYATPKDLISFLNKLNIRILNNEGFIYKHLIDDIFFAGIPDLYSKAFDLELAFKKSPANIVKILISHNPDIIDFVKKEDDIDLILSGHNHSGQIYIKPLGALLPMPSKKRWLTKGIFNIVGKTRLFLSQGVGYGGSRLRIGTESEICLINLIPKKVLHSQ